MINTSESIMYGALVSELKILVIIYSFSKNNILGDGKDV